MHPCSRGAVTIFGRAKQFHSGATDSQIYLTPRKYPVAENAPAFIIERIPEFGRIVLLEQLKLLLITFRLRHI